MDQIHDRLHRAADIVEIQQLINRIARSSDRRDWATMVSCFHPGAIDNHGFFEGPIEDFARWTSDRHTDITLSQHHISNIIVDFRDEATAAVESYCLVWQSLSQSDGDSSSVPAVIATSRYVDVVTRTNGGPWKVAERTVVFEASKTTTVARATAQERSSQVVGTRDTSDCLWTVRGKLGISS
ncbi:nuclear transport factor 2 family protein [Sphingomonadaceae bacterium G21617-S1]|uniref:nuclear transport factor 2 family protein n=1 Tax=Rhizorhabdus sp. TaxID=1968843 RepID=UPI001996531B|nr:nuclear transport factor 2 family protein [Rhizorhabdus sp.]MBD3761665.1 nuclear transport factor 2 family protein [Rhizorhabdus sp.]MCZ4343301.1 nuclear transport factor 2 family protein [Sphingomonadaceae bacterium G21617-S1]